MEISYKGAGSLIIATKKTTLLIDPNVAQFGLKNPSVTDAVEVATDERFVLPGARLLIETPGEYEVGEFSITGIPARRSLDSADARPKATIYRIETTELRLGILGHIENKLSEEQLEGLGVVDILVVPVGGNGYTLDPHDAATLARQIDPKVIIPIHYEDNGVKYEVPQLPLEQFTHELNIPVETVDRYKLKNAAGLPDAFSVVVVNRS